MPNYFVTNTARFNPFSYQELALPLMQATEAQYALEDVLSTVDDGTLETYLAKEDSNSPYRERYNSLTDRLQAASNELASRGLNPTLMREVKALRSDYNRFKTPVETAGKKKAALMDEYRKLKVSNPYLIGDDPGQKSLQYYIENPNYNPTYDNGKAYIEQGALIGSQLADQLRNPDAPYTIVPGSGGAFLRAVYRRGYTPEEIANDPMFVDITNGILKSKGIDPEADDDRTNAIRAYIQQGLFSSLGKDDVDTRNNPNFMTPLQQLQYNKAKRELDLLDNPPQGQDDYRSWFGKDAYTGEGYAAAAKIQNTIQDLSEKGLTSVAGEPLNNSLDVYRYLDGYRTALKKAKTPSEYEKIQKLYHEESERLKDYTISRSDYRFIKNNLGFENDDFDYNTVQETINNNPRRYGSGYIIKYELANSETSPEQLNRYLNLMKQGLNKYDDSSKGQFYTTDRVNTLEPLNIKKFKEIISNEDTEIYGLNGTTQLLYEHEGNPYVYLSTSKGDIAVPVNFLEFAGIPLSELAKLYNAIGDNTTNFFAEDPDSIGIYDDSVRESNAFNRQRTVGKIDPSRGKK